MHDKAGHVVLKFLTAKRSTFLLQVLSIMQGLGPGWSWWDPLQAFLFSVAILSGCVV